MNDQLYGTYSPCGLLFSQVFHVVLGVLGFWIRNDFLHEVYVKKNI